LSDDIDAVSVRTGTQNLAAGAAVTTVRVGATGAVRLSVGGLKARDFEPIGLTEDEIAFRPRPKRGSLNAEAMWQVLPKVRITAEGSIVDTRTAARFGAYFFDMYFRLKSMRAGAIVDTAAGVITADYYRNDNKLNYLASFGPDYIDNSVEVAKVSDLIKLNTTNIVRVGAEYRRNAVDGVDYGGHLSYDVMSGGAMWEWKPRANLTLTNAARMDRLELSYDGTLLPNSIYTIAQYNSTGLTAFSFNSGLVWTASDFDTVRFTIARGVQAPSLDEFGVQLPGDPPFSGDPNIRPAYSWNVGAAYEHALPDIGGRARAAIFAQRNEDLLGEVFFANPTVWPNGETVLQAANIGSSKQVGLELEIKGRLPSGFRWNAGYAFNEINDNLLPGQANAAFNYSQSTPRHAVVLGAGYSRGPWEADAQVRWQSSFMDYKVGTGPSDQIPVFVGNYITANARVGYNITENVTLAIAAQRLTQRKQMQSAGPVSERRVIVSATAGF
jgi:outer membrane receptor for ferrienterochelin and colicins